VPKPAVSSCSTCRVRKAELFDHLVGGSEQGRRNGEAEHRGGLDVEDQLELARLYNRQVGGLRTLEDAADINTACRIASAIRAP
jgi:hypothetical protein